MQRKPQSIEPRRSRFAARARGFTLLELVLVLAVMAIGAALVVPALINPTRSEVRSVAADVIRALRLSREHAINDQAQAVLALDTVQGRVMPPAGVDRVVEAKQVELSLITARSEVIDEGLGQIRFFPDGSSTGGRVSVSRDGATLHIDVDWLTGRIRAFDPSAEADPGVFDPALAAQ